MGNPAGVRRDFEALQQRRMRAARLLGKGLNQSEVARRLGVHRQSVSRWAQQLEQNGRAGLKRAGRAGRKPRLTPGDLRRIKRHLKRESAGDRGVWTCRQVADVIEHKCGVAYHPGHVWRMLRQLGCRWNRRGAAQPRGTKPHAGAANAAGT